MHSIVPITWQVNREKHSLIRLLDRCTAWDVEMLLCNNKGALENSKKVAHLH